ncbi:MAG TPA: hypothetical protein PLB38_02595 [bacterium]|nr:hypothetical protein [bacterium]
MINAKRRKGETFESLIRRFNRLMVKSKKVILAKSKRFTTKEKNELALKNSALRRLQTKGRMDNLRRKGKLEESRERYW